jgi:hypothetical protein
LEGIERIESWAREVLGISEDTAMWEINMSLVLECLKDGERITAKDVESRARKAVELDDTNWRATYTLARVADEKGNEDAITKLNELINRFSDDQDWRANQHNRDALADMYFTLGNRYWMQSSPTEVDSETNKAIDAYFNGLNVELVFRDKFMNVTEKLSSKSMWSQLAGFLKRLLEASTTSTSPVGRLVGLEMENNQRVQKSRRLENDLIQMAKALDHWDLLQRVYEAAMTEWSSQYWRKFWVQRALGRALMNNPALENKGLEILESILTTEVPDDNTNEGYYVLDYMTGTLMPIYTRYQLQHQSRMIVEDATAKVAANTISSAPPDYWALKIDKLFKQYDDSERSYNGQRYRLTFSRYYFKRGDMARAKEEARELLEPSLEMLSDDDPSNDQGAFWNLGMIFVTFDDQVNARAAWDMMAISRKAEYDKYLADKKEYEAALARLKSKQEDELPPTDETPAAAKSEPENTKPADSGLADDKEDNPQPSVTEDGQGGHVDETTPAVATGNEASAQDLASSSEELPIEPDEPSCVAYCDAYCGHEWNHPSDVWVCLDDCGFVQFNTPCYEKLKAGTLVAETCDKSHEFFHIETRDFETAVGVPMGSVRVGESIITMEAWKAKIKELYLDTDEDATAAEDVSEDVVPKTQDVSTETISVSNVVSALAIAV